MFKVVWDIRLLYIDQPSDVWDIRLLYIDQPSDVWEIRLLYIDQPSDVRDIRLLYIYRTTIRCFGRLGIEPKTGLTQFLKTVLSVFCIHKTFFFFLEFFFLYLI